MQKYTSDTSVPKVQPCFIIELLRHKQISKYMYHDMKHSSSNPFTILHNSTGFTFCTLSADFNYHIHVFHHLTHQMFEQKKYTDTKFACTVACITNEQQNMRY